MGWIPFIETVGDLAPPYDISLTDWGYIEEAVYEILTGELVINVGTRVYPRAAPQDAELPYIVYHQISGLPDRLIATASGLVKARFQVNAYASSFSGVDALADKIRLALDGYSGTAANVKIQSIFLQNEISLEQGEADMSGSERYGRALDFIIWFDEHL